MSRIAALVCALALPALAAPRRPAQKFVHPCTKSTPVMQVTCTGASDGLTYGIKKCGAELFGDSTQETWPVQHSKHMGSDVYRFGTTGFELIVKGSQGSLRITKGKRVERVSCSAGGSAAASNGGSGAPAGNSSSAANSGGGASAGPGNSSFPSPHSAKCNFCYGTASKTKPQWDSDLSAERQKILSTAEGYLHTVSDCGGPGQEKFGADTLVDIYKTAFGSLDSATEKQVRKANNRGWKSGPWSWCGIFAAAVMQKAGFSDIGWGIGKLKGREVTRGHNGVKPGDIAIWAGGLNHHDIVEKVEGSVVYTLDGNQECSGIMRKKRKLNDLVGYYKIAND